MNIVPSTSPYRRRFDAPDRRGHTAAGIDSAAMMYTAWMFALAIAQVTS
jgi:hypothetical protein